MRTLFDTPLEGAPDPRRSRTPDMRERRRVLTVSELNSLAREALEREFPSVWVEGEISNLRRYPSGHVYFTLKDDAAQISAVLFRGAIPSLRFRAEDGLKVLARGRVSLYETRGSFQIIVDDLEPAGLGALQLAFEQLKARLHQEGLFDPARKRPLPLLPRRIGVVASPAGAALRDILKVLSRRFANLEVVLAPSRVQGEGASLEIVDAIRLLNRLGGVDVLILARGGGSLEDLWPFNEERVARAIAASQIPVVSAVGHEVDVTIADLVADLRAPTPSAAAEMVVRSKEDLMERIAIERGRLLAAMRLKMTDASAALEGAGPARALRALRDRMRDLALRLDDGAAGLEGHMKTRATEARHHLAILGERMRPGRLAARLQLRRAAAVDLGRRLESTIASRVERARAHTAACAETLQALSPLAVLSRGYAICRLQETGAILKDSDRARPGDAVSVLLHHGSLDCEVTEVRAHGKREEGV